MNMNRRCGKAWSRLGTRALPLFLALLVSILAPALAEATAITLAWDPNSDSVTAGYYVYYGIQSGNYSGYVDVGGATTAIINTKDSTTTYYFAVQAYSSSGDKSPYSTEVVWTPSAPVAQPPTLSNPGSMSTTVGSSAVSLQLVATDPGGLALTYSASGLPPGLAIASNSGVISGTPTTAAGYSVTATVKNTANLTASQSFTWTILNQPAQSPSLLNPGNQTNVVGQSVSLQLSATDPGGLALQYSASGLPPGLSIASSTGRISGTPTTVGTYNVTARATNTAGLSASQSFTWSITAQPVTTSPTPSPGNGNGNGNGNGGTKPGNGNGNGNGHGGGGTADTSPIDSGVSPDPGTVVDDVTPPAVTILSPASGSTYSTTNAKIVLTGIAVDDVGVVSVTWSCSRGGGQGVAEGTSSWSTPVIDLKMGTNVVTITATDAAGNVQTITLTVTRYADLQNQLN